MYCKLSTVVPRVFGEESFISRALEEYDPRLQRSVLCPLSKNWCSLTILATSQCAVRCKTLKIAALDCHRSPSLTIGCSTHSISLAVLSLMVGDGLGLLGNLEVCGSALSFNQAAASWRQSTLNYLSRRFFFFFKLRNGPCPAIVLALKENGKT